jgi:hypothetical protein
VRGGSPSSRCAVPRADRAFDNLTPLLDYAAEDAYLANR